MAEEESELYDINIPKFVYNKLVQISEIYSKYISGYKSLTKDYIKNLKSIHKTYDDKIKSIKSEFGKNKYFNLSLLFPILNAIPSINFSFVDSLQFFMNELEKLVEGIQNFMKEKKIIYNKFFQNYNDAKKDLLIKMNDLEKEKINYLNNLSLTEKAISDYYKNKLKIEDYSKEHNNENNYVNNNEKNELKNLFIENNNLETQMEKMIKDSQNIEKNYKTLIGNSKLFKKTFFFSSNTTYENIKSISYEIIIEIKNFIQNIIILLKNCYTIPLKEIDADLSMLIKNKEEYNKKFNNIFENIKEKVSDQFLIEAKKYSLKVFNSDNINHFIFEDDPNDDSNYIDSDLDYLIAKTMLSSFTFINEKYKINFDLEDEKRTTNKIMSNLLYNIDSIDTNDEKENNIDNKEINDLSEKNNNELKYVHENDIQQLYKLLNNHHNRAVCLQTISHFRTSGKFCIPPKVFDIIGKCLLIIIDNVIKDEDYKMAKTAMILSQTYFKMDDKNEKYYLQNVIKDHKLFSNNEFWEKTLDNSLKNEINRVKNIKKENEFKNEINIEDENIEKYNDIAFGQIVSLVNSMIDFDINIEIIKKIIEPKIEEYKLNENHRQNINLVMQNKTNTDNNDINIKINTDKNENNKEEDTENKENINIIKNDDEDNKLVDENNINNIDIKSDEK
jgi:hypothetical protein